MVRYWVTTLPNDYVKGTGHARNIPDNVAPIENRAGYQSGTGLEITEAEYRNITATGTTFADGGGYRFRVVAGNVVEQTDDRPILQVEIADTEILLDTEELVGTLRVLRADRSLNTGFNRQGKLFLRHDGNGRAYRVNFTNGERSFRKTFSVPGRYEVVSDGSYAIDGVRFFDVVENL